MRDRKFHRKRNLSLEPLEGRLPLAAALLSAVSEASHGLLGTADAPDSDRAVERASDVAGEMTPWNRGGVVSDEFRRHSDEPRGLLWWLDIPDDQSREKTLFFGRCVNVPVVGSWSGDDAFDFAWSDLDRIAETAPEEPADITPSRADPDTRSPAGCGPDSSIGDGGCVVAASALPDLDGLAMRSPETSPTATRGCNRTCELVRIRLQVTDAEGRPISEIAVGDPFLLQVYVQDVRDTPEGVFAAYLDVTYAPLCATPSSSGGVTFGSAYQNGKSAGVTEPGKLGAVGAFGGLSALSGEEQLLFSLAFTADGPGTVEFAGLGSEEIGHEVLIYGDDSPVDWRRISVLSAPLRIVAAPSLHGAGNPAGAEAASDTGPCGLSRPPRDTAPTVLPHASAENSQSDKGEKRHRSRNGWTRDTQLPAGGEAVPKSNRPNERFSASGSESESASYDPSLEGESDVISTSWQRSIVGLSGTFFPGLA